MADLVVQQGSSLPPDTKTRYRDMGDGTHALVTAPVGDVDVLTEPSGTGAYTTATHTTLGVTAATQAALAANANRLYVLLVNDSDAVIYLKIGAAAVLNQGIRLNANGGSYEMCRKMGNLNLGAVNAITAVATKVLLVTEGV